MATLKGTWRFNDVLDIVDNDLTANINFTSTATYIPDGVKYVYNCEALRLREGYEVTYFEYLVQSSVPEDATFPLWRSVYWSNNWDADHYDDGIKTITFTSEQEVSDEFYEWFTANATPQAKAKVFKRLYSGDTVATSGTRVFKKLTTEKPAKVLEAGLYDENDNLLASWDTLVNTYGLDVEKDYTSSTVETDPSSAYWVLTNNSELSTGTKMVVDVPTIGKYAFCCAPRLTSVCIGKSVTNLTKKSFYLCSYLIEIVVSVENAKYSNDDNGILYNKDKTILIVAPGAITGDIFIPDSVADIEAAAFHMCWALTSIAIPDGITEIGSSTFAGCLGMTSVIIPKSVKSISIEAFVQCTNLKNVYYKGSKSEWDKIYVSIGNECLTNATIHYNYTG